MSQIPPTPYDCLLIENAELRARVTQLESALNRIINEHAVMGPDARWLQSFARAALGIN